MARAFVDHRVTHITLLPMMWAALLARPELDDDNTSSLIAGMYAMAPMPAELLAALRADGEKWLTENPEAQIALTGDWNIAPRDEDVWDPAFFEGKTHVTQPERDAFQAMIDTGYADVVRPHTNEPRTYTYWDYTQLRFPKKQGMRIDFALCSPALAGRVQGAVIDRDERKGKGASDHAPVIVQLD